MPKKSVSIHVKTNELDTAIEKANRLIALLKEVRNIIGSLHGSGGSKA